VPDLNELEHHPEPPKWPLWSDHDICLNTKTLLRAHQLIWLDSVVFIKLMLTNSQTRCFKNVFLFFILLTQGSLLFRNGIHRIDGIQKQAHVLSTWLKLTESVERSIKSVENEPNRSNMHPILPESSSHGFSVVLDVKSQRALTYPDSKAEQTMVS
jgi:hypothetical protein